MIGSRLSKLKQLTAAWDSDLFDGEFHFLLQYVMTIIQNYPPK